MTGGHRSVGCFGKLIEMFFQVSKLSFYVNQVSRNNKKAKIFDIIFTALNVCFRKQVTYVYVVLIFVVYCVTSVKIISTIYNTEDEVVKMKIQMTDE